MRKLIQKKTVFIFILIFVAAILWWFKSGPTGLWPLSGQSNSTGQATVSTTSSLPSSPGASSASVGSADFNTARPEEVAVAVEAMNANQFQSWVQTQAQNLNQATVNEALTESQLKKVAQHLTASQIEQLSQVSLDPNESANDRIFSVYLLTQTEGAAGAAVLGNIAQSQGKDWGSPQPHTEAELKHAQELSLRYMAVDQLARQAATDTAAFDRLKSVAKQAEMPQVRQYAQKKISEIH